MNRGNKRSVSVDDLLRLKRTEQPPQDFWAEFDRQLRAKQLAALVGKRPWWRTASSFAAFWPRVRIPLGVATVVGIGILSVRSYRSPAAAPAAVAGSELAQPAIAVVAPAISLASLEVTALPVPSIAVVASVAVERASLVAEHPIQAVADIVVQASAPTLVASEITTPSQSALDRALVAPALAINPVAENRVAASASSRPRIDPLQQMTPPGESRRARFLTAMVSTAAVETSVRISERAASRFAEDRLQDQGGRFGARGDRVNLKF